MHTELDFWPCNWWGWGGCCVDLKDRMLGRRALWGDEQIEGRGERGQQGTWFEEPAGRCEGEVSLVRSRDWDERNKGRSGKEPQALGGSG